MKESRVARRQHALALLSKRIERIKAKDVRIMQATQLAAAFDDDIKDIPYEVDGRVLTPLERRVARDARNCKRDAPIYLELAAKRYDVEQKISALRSSPTPLNAMLIAVIQGNPEQTAQYPVIDVEAKDVTSKELPALPEPVRKEKEDGT